jgi:hypothetical protein
MATLFGSSPRPVPLSRSTSSGCRTVRRRRRIRLHLDLNATDRDQGAELARLRDLGAVQIDIGQGEVTWEVLADPEGNEFCLLRRRVAPV